MPVDQLDLTSSKTSKEELAVEKIKGWPDARTSPLFSGKQNSTGGIPRRQTLVTTAKLP
jgi:hypothetical protein